MSKVTKTKRASQSTEKDGAVLSRRKFMEIAGLGALAGPLLIDTARAQDVVPGTLQSMGRQFAGVELSNEEAAALSPSVQALSKGVRDVDVSEEVEPVIVFIRRKEK